MATLCKPSSGLYWTVVQHRIESEGKWQANRETRRNAGGDLKGLVNGRLRLSFQSRAVIASMAESRTSPCSGLSR
jgi:hypothetical protein